MTRRTHIFLIAFLAMVVFASCTRCSGEDADKGRNNKTANDASIDNANTSASKFMDILSEFDDFKGCTTSEGDSRICSCPGGGQIIFAKTSAAISNCEDHTGEFSYTGAMTINEETESFTLEEFSEFGSCVELMEGTVDVANCTGSMILVCDGKRIACNLKSGPGGACSCTWPKAD